MEIYCGLVGGGEKGGGNILAAESANHCAGIKGPIAYLKEIMVGLGGEVEELNVGTWEKKKEEMKLPCHAFLKILLSYPFMGYQI